MEDLSDQLEQDVLRLFLDGDDPVLEILRSQLSLATRKSREVTSVGFFSNFDVPEKAPRLPGKLSLRLTDVWAEIEGVEHGAMFVLFIDNGVLTMLEGSTSEEPWPPVITAYSVHYTNNKNAISRPYMAHRGGLL